MGLIVIYSVIILANLFIQSYLFGFRGKMTAIIYEEGSKISHVNKGELNEI